MSESFPPDALRLRWYGESWGAPVCADPEDRVPTPIGERCTRCDVVIVLGDRGLLVLHLDDAGAIMRPVHLACFLRSVSSPPSFTCPRCGARSYNENDRRERYCARCHVFVDDPEAPT